MANKNYDKTWTVVLMIILGLVLGVFLSTVGAAIFGFYGQVVFAIIGATWGGWLGYKVKPTSFGDMFFWKGKK